MCTALGNVPLFSRCLHEAQPLQCSAATVCMCATHCRRRSLYARCWMRWATWPTWPSPQVCGPADLLSSGQHDLWSSKCGRPHPVQLV